MSLSVLVVQEVCHPADPPGVELRCEAVYVRVRPCHLVRRRLEEGGLADQRGRGDGAAARSNAVETEPDARM